MALKDPRRVLESIKGYSLPFIKKPPLIFFHDQQVKIAYATLHWDIEVNKMISQGVLERSTFQTGFVSHMFSTLKPDDKNNK